MSCNAGPCHTRRPRLTMRRRVSAATAGVLQAMTVNMAGAGRLQTDQHVATIGGWQQYGVVVVKLSGCLCQECGGQRRAIGTYHQYRALVQREGALDRAAHACTEVTVALVAAELIFLHGKLRIVVRIDI